MGDPRFLVEPAITGIGPAQRLHLLIKALDVGLDTSLVVTNRTEEPITYVFALLAKQFMPYVSFIYPEDAQAKWDAIRVKETIERHNNTIPLPRIPR
ncbi:P-type conjugative transfer protein TrbG (plasmid) [Legionella sp. PC1000]|nr:P-type conjugative transfer protein TrbG [Legionella sp. PC1000]